MTSCAGDDTCVEIRLNLMFTAAAVTTNVAALPVGAILDHYGPRVSGCLGALFLALGSVVMAHAKRLPFDGFLLGYLLLALGGPFTYISSFQLSNAFPRRSGFILALLTGAFDASSALFLVYRIIFERTGGAFGHERFFLAYLVVPVVIVITQFTILPAQSYKTVGELIQDVEDADDDDVDVAVDYNVDADEEVAVVDDQVDEETALLRAEQREHRAAVAHEVESLLGTAPEAAKQARREEARAGRSGVWGVLHHQSAWQQLRSAWFWLICLFTVVQMTRINYFVATIRSQYEALLGSRERAAAVNGVFDVALPLGGIASIPFIGGVLDHFSTVTVLATLVATAAVIGVLGVVPHEGAAYANVALFVLYRPFYYTAVSDYAAKVFGFRTFGTVYGAVICLAGLVNFVQSGLDYLFHETCRGDPVPVNLLLLALGLAIGLPLVAFVAWNVRARNAKALARDAARRARA